MSETNELFDTLYQQGYPLMNVVH